MPLTAGLLSLSLSLSLSFLSWSLAMAGDRQN